MWGTRRAKALQRRNTGQHLVGGVATEVVETTHAPLVTKPTQKQTVQTGILRWLIALPCIVPSASVLAPVFPGCQRLLPGGSDPSNLACSASLRRSWFSGTDTHSQAISGSQPDDAHRVRLFVHQHGWRLPGLDALSCARHDQGLFRLSVIGAMRVGPPYFPGCHVGILRS